MENHRLRWGPTRFGRSSRNVSCPTRLWVDGLHSKCQDGWELLPACSVALPLLECAPDPSFQFQFQQHITRQGYKQQIAHIKKVISPPSAPRAVVEPGCSCSVRCLPCQTIPGLGASSSVPSSPDGAHNPPVSFSDFHVALITVTPPLFHHTVPVPPAVVEQLLPCQNSHKIENVSQFIPMSQLLAESNEVKQRRRNVVKLFWRVRHPQWYKCCLTTVNWVLLKKLQLAWLWM